MITKITVDSLNSGYHELKNDKIFWIDKKKDLKLIDKWDIIPFEIEKTATKVN